MTGQNKDSKKILEELQEANRIAKETTEKAKEAIKRSEESLAATRIFMKNLEANLAANIASAFVRHIGPVVEYHDVNKGSAHNAHDSDSDESSSSSELAAAHAQFHAQSQRPTSSRGSKDIHLSVSNPNAFPAATVSLAKQLCKEKKKELSDQPEVGETEINDIIKRFSALEFRQHLDRCTAEQKQNIFNLFKGDDYQRKFGATNISVEEKAVLKIVLSSMKEVVNEHLHNQAGKSRKI